MNGILLTEPGFCTRFIERVFISQSEFSLTPAGTKIPGHLNVFRHTYSTLLRAFRVDVKVQQELLRYAEIRTTVNT
jgi:hypothetical protein